MKQRRRKVVEMNITKIYVESGVCHKFQSEKVGLFIDCEKGDYKCITLSAQKMVLELAKKRLEERLKRG